MKKLQLIPVIFSIVILIATLCGEWLFYGELQEDWFLTFLKIVVTLVSIYLIWFCRGSGFRYYLWIFCLIAILFNPLIPVSLEEDILFNCILLTIISYVIFITKVYWNQLNDFLRRNNETINNNEENNLRGIGGWLLVPAIGLIVGPIKAIFLTYTYLNMIKTFMPELIDDTRLSIIVLIDVVMIIGSIFVAFYFFKKKREAVLLIICLFSASIIASLIQMLLNVRMLDRLDFGTIKPFLHASIFGSIWIPYFLKSRRVNNTFKN